MDNKEKSEFERGRQGAVTFAGLVYAGVVVAATTIFISFVLTAFPSDAYFSRFIMVIAGLLIGASMLAFPYALHVWAISGRHRQATIALYYGEMFIIALNTIVSFAALLFKYAQIPLPEWIVWYEPFSIVSMVYTLFAWGTIFLTDPAAKAKAKQLEAQQEFDRRASDRMMEYLDTIEGEDAVMAAANKRIEEHFKTQSSEPRHFGSHRSRPVIPPILDDQRVKMSDNGNKPKDF